MMEKLVYVQGGRRVSFTSDDGEKIEGMNIFYHEEIDQDINDGFGLLPSKQWIKPEGFKQFTNGSGYYKMKINVDITGNRPRIIIDGFTFVSKDQPKAEKVS